MAYGNGGAGGSIPTIGGSGVLGMSHQAAQTSGYATEARRQPVISEQLSTLEKQVEMLAGIVVELEARIDPILMVVPPAPNAPNCDRMSAPHPGVALGASIGVTNERIAIVMQRLRNIIERVEL